MSRFLILACIVIAFCGAPADARGAAPLAGTFGMAPETGGDPDLTARGYFLYTMEAGTQASGMIRLRNPGSAPLTVQLAAVDGLTAQSGGSAFTASEAAPLGAGAWLHLETSQVTLVAKAEETVRFSVQPPRNAAPGQYLAGLAAYVPISRDDPPERSDVQASATIAVQPRSVIAVEIDVRGAWEPSLTITGASAVVRPTGTQFEVTLRNDGDQFIRPEGALSVTDAAGRTILDQPIKLGSIITGTNLTYPIAWPEPPAAGEYSVKLALRYAEDHVAHYSGTVAIAGAAAARPALPTAVPTTVVSPSVPAPAPAPVPAAKPGLPRDLLAGGALLSVIVTCLAVVLLRHARSGPERTGWWAS